MIDKRNYHVNGQTLQRKLIMEQKIEPSEYQAVVIGIARRRAVVHAHWISFEDFYAFSRYGRKNAQSFPDLKITVEFVDVEGNKITGTTDFYP